MPSRRNRAPRAFPKADTAIALLLFVAGMLYFKNRSAVDEASHSAGDPLSKTTTTRAAPSAPDATGPALTRKPRPASDPFAALMKGNHEREAQKELAARLKRRDSYLAPGSGYQLTPEFLADSGLAPEQLADAQKVLDGEWTRMAAWAASRVTFDEAASGKAAGEPRIYRMSALAGGELEASHARLLDSLQKAVPAATPEALSTIVDAIGNNPSFGFHGAADSEIHFIPTVAALAGEKSIPSGRMGEDGYLITCRLRDPADGRVRCEIACGFKAINEYYGDIFQLPEYGTTAAPAK